VACLLLVEEDITNNIEEKEECDDFKAGTYHVEMDDIEFDVPNTWVNKNPYFFSEGQEDTADSSMLFVGVDKWSYTKEMLHKNA